MTVVEQMELGVRSQIRNGCRNRREDRLKRARWWFSRMRQAVDLALPARTAPAPRPEQIYLNLHQGRLF